MVVRGIVVMGGSLGGAAVGGKVGEKMKGVYLEWGVGVMIRGRGVKIWVDIL
ncbi:hypothetical protein [Bacillus sp. WP8]|uniref:hypothetical protein n=1 Tax=Bacillus sp. WP8 TaxID=756828 RepID=UPI00164290D6|nr:hypothetical protein [Bacillus sp. WP8]